ncbi:MAG: hypothetical protein ABJH72_03940 [Reichenbachiella sp.]|uniref:hypothetical protein n=1 Tax=Reichenbachiella sp. TaxID=2184521 RepID=UPI0032975200
MNNLKIEVVEKNVVVFDGEGNDLYTIPLVHLDEVREENLSEWVLQLEEKKWVSYELLQNLADIIKKECPDNTIDWNTTFSMVRL